MTVSKDNPSQGSSADTDAAPEEAWSQTAALAAGASGRTKDAADALVIALLGLSGRLHGGHHALDRVDIVVGQRAL
jgi:hypothetical protein